MIRDFLLLQRLEFTQFLNGLRNVVRTRPITLAVVALLALGFYGGYIWLTHLLVKFIVNQPIIGMLLATKLLQILLLIALGMAFMSSLNIALANLYLSKDLEFQFSLPVRFRGWMIYKYVQMYLQSNWMLVAFGAPFVVIFMKLSQAPIVIWPIGLVAFMVVCSFPVTLAGMLCLFLVRVFPAKRLQQVFFVMTLVAASFLVFFFRYLEPEKFLGPGGLDVFKGYMDLVSLERQKLNPAIWASNLIVLVNNAQWKAAFPYAARLAGLFLASLWMFFTIGQNVYRSSWDRALQSLSGEGEVTLGVKKTSFLSRKLSSMTWSQEIREVLLFVRDPSQWSQVFVLAALLGLYLFSLDKIPKAPFGGTIYALALGNSGLVAFITLSLTSRFLFTGFSGDGQAIWLMKTAPSGWGKFTRGKILVFGLPILCFAELLTLGSAWMIKLTGNEMLRVAAYCLWDSGILILLSAAMGMVFINPLVENPLKLMVSPGGFFLMALGMFMAFLHVMLRLCSYYSPINELMMLLKWPDLEGDKVIPYWIAIGLAELSLCAWLLKKGYRHLRLGDFA